jgi:hypothetical protein
VGANSFAQNTENRSNKFEPTNAVHAGADSVGADSVGANSVGANSVGANSFAQKNSSNKFEPKNKFEPANKVEPAKLIYRPGETVADHPHSLTLDRKIAPNSITLQFLTPLRLQENGHALPPARLTPRQLLMALVRRASLLVEHHHGQPLLTPAQFTELAHAANGIEGLVQMEWRDWTRRSARQQCTMQLGGCIGTWTLTGDLAPFWNFLRLGEYLHVGKEASFGLGQYRLLP